MYICILQSKMYSAAALAVSPGGKRVVIADTLNHVVREYTIALGTVHIITNYMLLRITYNYEFYITMSN